MDLKPRLTVTVVAGLIVVIGLTACDRPHTSALSAAPTLHIGAVNDFQSVPIAPLGTDIDLVAISDPPTSARIALGRFLFFDARLSSAGSIACATCHRPELAFSDGSAVSSGIRQQKGSRKAPALINLAAPIYPHFFRDGRASSLEAQALEPIINPIEMGNTREGVLKALRDIDAYRPYFAAAFGDPEVTTDRVAKALADYVRTRMSGNSPWDRWRRNHDESAVSQQVNEGHELFFGKAGCNQCHLGSSFTDSSFHNLGIGWDPQAQTFRDEGRYGVTNQAVDRGAFKTPTLREVTKHPPYMHDGSIATLRDVLDLYNRGAESNPYLDPRIRPLQLTEQEIDALLAFLHALEGEGYADESPKMFPQ